MDSFYFHDLSAPSRLYEYDFQTVYFRIKYRLTCAYLFIYPINMVFVRNGWFVGKYKNENLLSRYFFSAYIYGYHQSEELNYVKKNNNKIKRVVCK